MKRSGVRGCEPILVTTLPAGVELANCTETAMFYDRVLAAGLIYFVSGFDKGLELHEC